MDTWRTDDASAAGTTPNDPMTDVDDESRRAFVAATSFGGARPGHVFKSGAHGLGYYRDDTAPLDAPWMWHELSAFLGNERERLQENDGQ